MSRNLKWVFVLLFGSLLVAGQTVVLFAQPEAVEAVAVEAVAVEEDVSFGYGEVVSAAADKVVILEYDLETGEEFESTYSINAETQYENVGTATELVAGDEIEVQFKEESGQKMAKVIYRDTLDIGDEEIIEDTEEGTEELLLPESETPQEEQEVPDTTKG